MALPPRIAIIGTGKMGSALIEGLITHGHPAEKLWASNPSLGKLQSLQKKWAVSITTDNKIAVQNTDVIIFAVKPPLLSTIAQELAPLIQAQQSLVISIVTGIQTHQLQQWLGDTIAIIRCMPNTPALIGCSASALYANAQTSNEKRHIAESILSSVGTTLWMKDEKQMNAVTALSGSGPAYFFMMIEAMQQAGQALGLSEETARTLTLQTAYGSALLALESNKTVTELRHDVTSPGGTTEAALRVLEQGQFCSLIKSTLQAAQRRAEELGM